VSRIQLGLKVDVCTHAGMKDGVPALMRLFDELNVRASFFIACGPDHSGRAIRRLFRPGFLDKMRRTNAVGTYGWRTILYGTLLPGPQIAGSFPDSIRALVRAGHEVGMHGYDHVFWQDRLLRLPAAAIRAELGRARAVLTDVLGSPPQAFGAPGWQCTPTSLASEDAADLVYHSDTRGASAFLPEMDGQRFRTLEIPTTLPTLDETYGRIGTTPQALTTFYVQQLRSGLNVYTAHAEMEGIRQLPHLRHFLSAVRDQASVARLIDVARQLDGAGGTVPVARIVPRTIPGRAGTVACQEALVA
jgi:peptidoglycan/xylan/chitin deacetylase (PgdA/CDA1 family)